MSRGKAADPPSRRFLDPQSVLITSQDDPQPATIFVTSPPFHRFVNSFTRSAHLYNLSGLVSNHPDIYFGPHSRSSEAAA